MELRHVVNTLLANQTSMMAKSERMEEQYNELKALLVASKGPAQMPRIPEKELPTKEPSKDLEVMHEDEQAASLSYTNPTTQAQSEVTMAAQGQQDKVKASQSKPHIAKTPPPNHMLKQKKTKVHEHKNLIRSHDGSEGIIKCGMEVGLTSPNSAMMVALGTIQTTDRKAKAIDGQPLADFVEVLVNVVLKETTQLPRAQGRIPNLGCAQARCIPWPRQNVTNTDGTLFYSKVSSVSSQMPLNNKENLIPKRSTAVAKSNHLCGTSDGVVVHSLKKKAHSGAKNTATQEIRAPTGNKRTKNQGKSGTGVHNCLLL